MSWILIIVITWYGSAVTMDHIEFKSHESCNAAAGALSMNGLRVMKAICVENK